MRLTILTFVLTCLMLPVIAQDSGQNDSEDSKEEQKVYSKVEQMPEFPGGTDSLLHYIGTEVNYPEQAKEDSIEGMVVAQFVIGKDGQVTDAEILKGVHRLLDEEALRTVRSLPKWKPGLQDGVPVPVLYKLPIRFEL